MAVMTTPNNQLDMIAPIDIAITFVLARRAHIVFLINLRSGPHLTTTPFARLTQKSLPSMTRPRPGGGECSAGCGATHSSNWFKKAPNTICRACYGRATQRVGTHQSADGGPRRSSPTSVTAEMASIVNTLESWQDLEADVKTVVKILGCR
jgi:hypothetical protein